MELVNVRLHDRTGDNLGTIELPIWWTLDLGDLLAAEDGRLVRVAGALCEPGSPIAALVDVGPAASGA